MGSFETGLSLLYQKGKDRVDFVMSPNPLTSGSRSLKVSRRKQTKIDSEVELAGGGGSEVVKTQRWWWREFVKNESWLCRNLHR